MGPGMCSRRQKGLLHTGLCLLALASLCGGLYLYSGLQDRVKSFESLSVKYKQQQDALSAQLQGGSVALWLEQRDWEGGSVALWLEQRDWEVWEFQAWLTPCSPRSSQLCMNTDRGWSAHCRKREESTRRAKKNQLDDVRTQLQALHSQHSELRLSQRRAQEESSQREALQRKERENEVSGLQADPRMLRKASLSPSQNQLDDVRTQLQALHSQHSELRLSQRRAQEESSQREALQRKERENEVSGLQDAELEGREELQQGRGLVAQEPMVSRGEETV
ncbi:UNVERIFIED_CONTAM: hypothetical protein FKN15_000393 [Acipenser sinensis]